MMKLRGLYTFPNDMSAVPEGALSVADNIVIDKDSIAEPRRGLTFVAHPSGARADFATGDKIERIFFYKDGLLSLVSNAAPYNRFKYLKTTVPTGWTANTDGVGYWEVDTFSDIKPQSIQEDGNLYVTTGSGVIKLDALDAYPQYMGMSVPFDITPFVPTLNAAAPAWLPGAPAAPYNSVYYRYTYVRKDANGNTYESPPSSPYLVTNNTLTDSSVALATYYPPDVKAGDMIRLYRSDYSPTPDDELRVCFEEEVNLSGGNNHSEILDNCPQETLGAYLYSNQSQGGVQISNYQPPLGKDIALYKDMVFVLNITERPLLKLGLKATQLAPANEPTAFRAGDTVTINSVVYTGLVEGSATPSGTFIVYTTGTTAQDTTNTMMDLARAVNLVNFSIPSGIYAQYVININNDLLGSIILMRKNFEAATLQFSANSNRPESWVPSMRYGAVDSSYEVWPNGIAGSKPNMPEAFPIPYRWYAGSKDAAILRGVSLRDSLFILKEDGVWRLWGTDPNNIQIALLDGTVNCIAPDSVVVLNNQIFALTTQGVVSITENGVTIVSRPIERDLLDLLATDAADMFNNAFAVGYESERAYTLFLPTVAADVYPTQYYRYNVITNNWTRGTLAKACGGVNPYDDRMYLGDRSRLWMDVERKTLTSFDYADYVGNVALTSVNGSTVIFNVGSSDLQVGRVIYQSDTVWGEIAAVSNVGAVYTVTMKYPTAFTSATLKILAPIDCRIKWIPNAFQNPGINKHYREATLIFLSDFYGQGSVSFETDQYPQILYETIEGSMASPWGIFPWGIAPWGGNSPRRRPVRIAVPRNHKRASWLKVGFEHDVCFSPWKIQGISVIGTNISEKVGTDT
jgi:hypothetical protein